MFGFKKKSNNKKNTRSNLHTTMMNFNPFMADTRYLEHLHKEMKLRSAREGMLMLRKIWLKATNEQTIKMKWIEYKMNCIDLICQNHQKNI